MKLPLQSEEVPGEEKVVRWQKKKGNQEFCFGQVRFEILMLHSVNVNQGVGAGYAFGHISEHMVYKVTGMN